jgi:single-stranded DNA-binding protein
MASQASINLLGHLATTPELRGEGDKQYTFLKILTNPTPRKDTKPEAIGFEVLLSGQDAVFATTYAKKGYQVAVIGEVTAIEVATDSKSGAPLKAGDKYIINTKVNGYRGTFKIAEKKADGEATMSAGATAGAQAASSGKKEEDNFPF